MEGHFLEADEIVNVACSACGIVMPFPAGMSNTDIARVCRWIGEQAPSSFEEDGKIVISADGWDAMIFVAILEFPWFFKEQNLAMVWRN